MKQSLQQHSPWTTWLLAAACAVGVLCLIILPAIHRPGSRPPSQGFKNMHQVALAMARYADKHGTLPYHPAGANSALYLLANEIDASRFDVWPLADPASEAQWDHNARRLRGGDIDYVNKPHLQPSDFQIVMMTKPYGSRTDVIGGTGYGSLRTIFFPKKPDNRVLGSWITVDQLVAANEEAYEALAETHAFPGHSWSSTSECSSESQREVKISATVAGNSLKYVYTGDHLTGCVINGAIRETFTLDDLDRVVRVSREPEHWRELLHGQ